MWKNKSGAVADSHPFWIWWSLIYTLLSATLPLNVRIIWSDPFSDRFSSCVVCVCIHCCWTTQNRCLVMGLTNHLSCVYDDFSSYRVSFSLMMGLTIMILGPGHLVRAVFHFAVVKWWNALFNFLMVKWWNALFYYVMVKCSFTFFCGWMMKWFFKLIGIEPKVGRLIEIFSRSKSWIFFHSFQLFF